MTFGEKLREIRDGAGLSEAKLAELSGVSFGAVHNYGLGIRRPTFAAVVKMARALGVSCEVFADCEDMMGDEQPSNQRLSTPEPRRGRPPKPKAESEPVAPRKRGRPRKDAAQ